MMGKLAFVDRLSWDAFNESTDLIGQGKNGYRLNQIRARLASTSEAWVRSIFLVMRNLYVAFVIQETGLVAFFFQ